MHGHSFHSLQGRSMVAGSSMTGNFLRARVRRDLFHHLWLGEGLSIGFLTTQTIRQNRTGKKRRNIKYWTICLGYVLNHQWCFMQYSYPVKEWVVGSLLFSGRRGSS